MKRVLITGINGFLGRNVAKRFLGEGYSVCGASRHSDNISDILQDILFFNCNLNSGNNEIEPVIAAANPDIVVHCAWDGGNSYAQTNSSIQFNNVLAEIELLNAMDKYHIPYFVGFGAASEYGDKPYLLSEGVYETPFNLYGACKKMAKEYSKVFCETKGIRWTWIRPFYTYGPGDVSTRLIPKVISACLNKTKLTLNSCGSQTDYLYIDDLSEGVFQLVEHNEEGIFNLCSGNLYLVRSIIELIVKETGYGQIIFDSSLDRKGFPSIMGGINGKMKIRTGWSPKVNIEEGIRKTIHEHNLLH